MISWAKKQSGFTIVELLIVVVVIAILAAITVVSYNGISGSANDSAVKSDLRNFAMKAEEYKVRQATYPAAISSGIEVKASKESYGVDNQNYTFRYCYNASTDQYILYARSKSGNYFKVINGVISNATASSGYTICSQIGLVSVNPNSNGYHTTSGWAAWVN